MLSGLAGRRQNKPFAVNMPHYVVRNSFLLPVAELSSAILLYFETEGILNDIKNKIYFFSSVTFRLPLDLSAYGFSRLRIFSLIGTPTNPKVSRMPLDKYRKYDSGSWSGLLEKIANVGGRVLT